MEFSPENGMLLRSVPPVAMTGPVTDLGERRLLTPTLLRTNLAPRPEDLLIIMDSARATFEVPLIVGQVPGKPPIVKFSPQRPFRRDSMKTKQIRVETIYGIIIISPIMEKKLTMGFSTIFKRIP